MKKALIIDDVENARILLKKDLEDYCPQIKVVGEADGVIKGMKAIQSLKPDILFLDINMGDGTGFDLLEMLGENQIKVIFTTASNEYAIKAFKFAAVDYLLKPIDLEELKQAVAKAMKSSESSNQNIQVLLESLDQQSKEEVRKIALHTMDKIHICQVDEIIRCEANVNYTSFYLKNGKQVLVTKTLKHYNELLSDSGFYRVHQSHLINLSQVREYVKTDGGYLVMNDNSQVPISSRKKAQVIELITNF